MACPKKLFSEATVWVVLLVVEVGGICNFGSSCGLVCTTVGTGTSCYCAVQACASPKHNASLLGPAYLVHAQLDTGLFSFYWLYNYLELPFSLNLLFSFNLPAAISPSPIGGPPSWTGDSRQNDWVTLSWTPGWWDPPCSWRPRRWGCGWKTGPVMRTHPLYFPNPNISWLIRSASSWKAEMISKGSKLIVGAALGFFKGFWEAHG